MKILYKNAKIYDTKRKDFFDRELLTDGSLIAYVDSLPYSGHADETVDCKGAYLAPGLVDIHTHGRAGGDFISADPEMLKRMSQAYLFVGVTTLLPTLASAPFEDMLDAAGRIADADCENFAGIHLEGRYINPQKRGVHAQDLLSRLDPDELEQFYFRMCGKHIHLSAAFELDGGDEFARRAKELGMTLGLAHTCATYEQATEAVDRGVTVFTHLFNSMPQMHHREGGAVCAGLLDQRVFCELIADGLHVSPPMVRLAYNCKRDKLILVTDSMEAAGCPDGRYSIAGADVTVENGVARTADGRLGGSTLCLLDAVKNLSKFADISFGEALYCATLSPARAVGMSNKVGSLEVGKKADMLVLDGDFNITSVIKNGRQMNA